MQFKLPFMTCQVTKSHFVNTVLGKRLTHKLHSFKYHICWYFAQLKDCDVNIYKQKNIFRTNKGCAMYMYIYLIFKKIKQNILL
jgi:hypothetical protein